MEYLVEIKGKSIQSNFEEYSVWLDEALKKYRGLVVEDDQIPYCKKMRAELNKAEKAINDRKIAIKKEFMKPYTEFENETKKLMSKISECSTAIDEQIKDYEERQKMKRYNWMKDWWNQHGILVPYEKVHNPDMLKLSISDNGVIGWLEAKVENIASDLEVIESMPEEQMNFVHIDYLDTLNLSQSVRNWQEAQRRNEEIEKARKAREEGCEKEIITRRAEIVGTEADLKAIQEYAWRRGCKWVWVCMYDDGLPF